MDQVYRGCHVLQLRLSPGEALRVDDDDGATSSKEVQFFTGDLMKIPVEKT